MGGAVKTERYAWIKKDGKHYLDIATYRDGTRYFNLRGLVPVDAKPTYKNGKKLVNYGKPLLQFVINRKGDVRAPLKNKRNAQERKQGEGSMQDLWKGWYNRWKDCEAHFHLEAVV